MRIPFYIHELFEKNKESIDSIFLISNNKEYTFNNVSFLGRKLASFLSSQGCKKGDRVVFDISSDVLSVLLLYAISYLGAISVPIAKRTGSLRKEKILKNCKPKIIISDLNFQRNESIVINRKDIFDLIDQFDPIDNTNTKLIDLDPAIIIYTSGSTGLPKGVTMSHSSIINVTESICRYLNIDSDSRTYNIQQLSFDYGLYQIFIAALRNARLIFGQGLHFVNDFIDDINNYQIDVLPLMPTQINLLYNKLGQNNYISLKSVKKITSTGAAFPINKISFINKLFPNASVFSMYGLTECKRALYLEPDRFESKSKSLGSAIPNYRVSLGSVFNEELGTCFRPNELIIESRSIMNGYWNSQSITNEKLHIVNGRKFLLTGDKFSQDNEGDFTFCGRFDNEVKYRGIRIDLLEYSSITNQVKDVNNSIAYLTTIKQKEEIILFVETKIGNELIERIKDILKQNLESILLIPSQIITIDKFPTNTNGKIDSDKLMNLII